METHIKVSEKVKLRSPVLVEGLPGIGNVGRVAAGYMISELKMKKFAELYSPHFLPLVILGNDAIVSMLKCEFYYYKSPKLDLIMLTGDTQSVSPNGHYEICDTIIHFAKSLGVKEVITLGGFAEGREVAEPRVVGAVNDKNLTRKYEKFGIDFGKDHPVGTIVGASGLLIGMARLHGMDGICLMGETFGMPLMTDPKSADRVLHVLTDVLGLKLDLSKIEKIIKEMEERIRKTDKIHKKMLSEMVKSGKDDQVRYIG